MQRRAWIFVAWAGLTGISVLIATQAVGMVRDQVTESPATIATVPAEVVAAPTDTTTTSTSVASTVAPSSVPQTTTIPPEPLETSTIPASTSTTTTTAAPAPTSPPVTTNAPPSTTTTTTTTTTTSAPPPAMETKTYQLEGGWVRIRYGGDEVRLVDAAPNAGYSIEIEKEGPQEVEVEFDGEDYEGKFSAKMRDGELVVEIEDDEE